MSFLEGVGDAEVAGVGDRLLSDLGVPFGSDGLVGSIVHDVEDDAIKEVVNIAKDTLESALGRTGPDWAGVGRIPAGLSGIFPVGIRMSGFAQLQHALRRIDSGMYPELRARLRAVGEHVKAQAAANVPHKTGRHNGPTIESGLRVSVSQRGASVYTLARQGGAINTGAWKYRGRGPHIRRASASRYMDRAVASSQA